MKARPWFAYFVAAACGTSSPAPKPAEPPPPATPVATPAITRSADGRCEPTPREGTPCHAGDSWCVISWGNPGGRSSALWCRDGRWVLEEEANLPEK